MARRVPLFYTFGNHMHWVDMEWLWGYHVLPGSIRDMLHFCRETGAKGNVNFDGVGYEKLAAEAPEALAELREAVQAGTVEVVGASYGQPYGLFHGGESNVRQRIYGVRAVQRLLGVRPRTFWEEEFDFFPQLPQILKGCGFENASLFFQWTWHTPEVPKEDVPVVWWEGQDGSRLLTATRNRLNLHQWPEDVDALLTSLAEETTTPADTPLVLQWLELMPSPDWMCRSEVLLPKTKELLGDERFEFRFGTLSDYLSPFREKEVPVRRYGMDHVFHGMSLGKNGDNMRRLSRQAEGLLLAAESLAAISALVGRPYAQWDVYPTWELEEAWRELLQAQHHDNDECEGLCGHVGRFSYDRAIDLAERVLTSNLVSLAQKLGGGRRKILLAPGRRLGLDVEGDLFDDDDWTHTLFCNPLGWDCQVTLARKRVEGPGTAITVPAFGYAVVEMPVTPGPQRAAARKEHPSPLEHGHFKVDCDFVAGRVRQISSEHFPGGVFGPAGAFGFGMTRNGQPVTASPAPPNVPAPSDESGYADNLTFHAQLHPVLNMVEVDVHAKVRKPDGGLNSAFHTKFHLSFRPRIIVDQPYGVSEVNPAGSYLKKYPRGDWMTSPQWFEKVERPFTSLSFVDLVDADDPDRGLLIVHDGSQQWFLDEDGSLRCVLNAYDPWDEDYFQSSVHAGFLLYPHGPITHAERWKIAQEYLRPPIRIPFRQAPEGPAAFGFTRCDAENVALTSLYRETVDAGARFPGYAARAFEANYPYVLRLLELNGEETTARLHVNGTVAAAAWTNLVGEELRPASWTVTGGSTEIELQMRPNEIATLYLDVVEGRKQTRDLDAKREVWATVHRV
jgi:alpha-mannosidase